MDTYQVFRDSSGELLSPFRQRLLKTLYDSYNINLDDFSLLHTHVNTTEVNSVRLSCFHALNDFDWHKHLFQYLYHKCIPFLGPDIVIQNKINLSIQMPNDQSSILSIHSDSNSGESVHQLNIWIPLTDCFSSNSMFIIDRDRSFQYYLSLRDHFQYSPKILSEDYVDLSIGDYILFPPILLHGNTLNKTSRTRVSLNFRVKSLFSPLQPLSPPDRMLGPFYSVWNISEWTSFANEVYRCLV